jgi:AraC family transcriptional activator of pobA
MKEPFKIFKLTQEVVEESFTNSTKPHWCDYEELILITNGKPAYFIDLTKKELISPIVVYTAKGKVHCFIPEPETRGWVIRYNDEFIPESRYHFYSNFIDNNCYQLITGCCLNMLTTLCEMMQKENQLDHPGYLIIKHLLSAFLAKLEKDNLCESGVGRTSSKTQLVILNNFLKILEHNYRRPDGAVFYSNKLNMTARNLNHISHSVFGKSVTKIIETRKLFEARKMLSDFEKTISEIGFELGYKEKSYFTHVFHKKTGLTPTQFREQMHYVIS